MKLSTISRFSVALFKHIGLKIRNGNRFTCTFTNSYSPSTDVKIHRGGFLAIGNHLSTLNDVTISVASGANLTIGKNVNINKSCSIVAKESVKIGDYVLFGPNCGVYDHDHNYKKKGKQRQEEFVTGKIEIGNGVWFGANCIILKNTKIGDNCVFGAGTIIRGEYPPDSIVVEKREYINKQIRF